MTAFSHYFWTIFKAFCELIVLLLDLTHTHTHTHTYTQFLNNQAISNPITGGNPYLRSSIVISQKYFILPPPHFVAFLLTFLIFESENNFVNWERTFFMVRA